MPVVEYTPAEIKRAVVGYGRAEKHAGAADGQAAARASTRCRRRTTPPTRSRSRSATCTRSRRRARSAPSSRRAAARPAGATTGRLRDAALRRDSPPDVIAHLRGRILEKHPNRIVVDVNGVGYDVHVPLSTFYGLGEPGATIALRIHTHVREDALALYGFATPLEQELFERLIGDQRHRPEAGARGAVRASSRPSSIARDRARRRRAADRDSRRRQEDLRAHRARAEGSAAARAAGGGAGRRAPRPRTELRDDVLSALVNLGYHRPLAEKAVDAALATSDRRRRRLRAHVEAGADEELTREHDATIASSPRRASTRTRSTRPGCGRARSTTTSARIASARTCRCRSPRPSSAARRSITCCCTARPASARRRSPTSSPTSWACRSARRRAR